MVPVDFPTDDTFITLTDVFTRANPIAVAPNVVAAVLTVILRLLGQIAKVEIPEADREYS